MFDCTEVTDVDGLTLRLVTSDSGLRAIDLDLSRRIEGNRRGTHPIAREAARQLRAYFAGSCGGSTSRWIWRAPISNSAYGANWSVSRTGTRSYLQIAAGLGAPRAVRAVGADNGVNPIPIVVPCHRVIGANGKLVGYGGGLPLKKRLLELEGAWALPLGYGGR